MKHMLQKIAKFCLIFALVLTGCTPAPFTPPGLSYDAYDGATLNVSLPKQRGNIQQPEKAIRTVVDEQGNVLFTNTVDLLWRNCGGTPCASIGMVVMAQDDPNGAFGDNYYSRLEFDTPLRGQIISEPWMWEILPSGSGIKRNTHAVMFTGKEIISYNQREANPAKLIVMARKDKDFFVPFNNACAKSINDSTYICSYSPEAVKIDAAKAIEWYVGGGYEVFLTGEAAKDWDVKIENGGTTITKSKG